MHIRRISVAKYLYLYPFKQGSFKLLSVSYPYPWELRISAKYLSADIYPTTAYTALA